MADLIKIVPEDFQRATVELRKVEALLVEHKAELVGKYSMMANGWRGEAGNAFGVCAQMILKDFEMNIANLGQLVADIEKVNQYMTEIEQAVTDIVNESNTILS